MKNLMFAFIFSICPLSVCYADNPSQNDIRQAVDRDIADCKFATVKSVSVVNGVRVKPLIHKVAFNYVLVIRPVPKEWLEAYDQKMAKHRDYERNHDAIKKEKEEVANAAYARMQEVEEKLNSLRGQAKQDLEAQGLMVWMPEYRNRLDSAVEAMGRQELVQQLNQLEKEFKAKLEDYRSVGYEDTQPKESEIWDRWGSNRCRNMLRVFTLDALRKEIVISNRAVFDMLKTDNGWMKYN